MDSVSFHCVGKLPALLRSRDKPQAGKGRGDKVLFRSPLVKASGPGGELPRPLSPQVRVLAPFAESEVEAALPRVGALRALGPLRTKEEAPRAPSGFLATVTVRSLEEPEGTCTGSQMGDLVSVPL